VKRALVALPAAVSVLLATHAVAELPVEVSGFLENRIGVRVDEHGNHDRESVAESRLQLELVREANAATFRVRTDLLLDAAADSMHADLDRGDGWLDLREASVLWYPPLDVMDIKAGRQILTWGTGDLIFINDLFPKDWVSFLLGRDDEYLKAPSDAVRVSVFSDIANVDCVYSPAFDPDRHISGRRLFYWNDGLGRIAGKDAIVGADVPDDAFRDDELAWRIYRNVKGYELALYGYIGFWKSPAGVDAASGLATFPALQAFGASVRGTVGKGIGNAEAGYYDSRDDSRGDDPFIGNSETRVLLGYEQEVARDLTCAVQYYTEIMANHGRYRNSLPEGSTERDEVRHVVTARLTQLLMNQNVRLSLVTLYSPSDRDIHLRPAARYAVSDALALEAGTVLSFGEEQNTFYGQFERNNSVFSAMRYSF